MSEINGDQFGGTNCTAVVTNFEMSAHSASEQLDNFVVHEIIQSGHNPGFQCPICDPTSDSNHDLTPQSQSSLQGTFDV